MSPRPPAPSLSSQGFECLDSGALGARARQCGPGCSCKWCLRSTACFWADAERPVHVLQYVLGFRVRNRIGTPCQAKVQMLCAVRQASDLTKPWNPAARVVTHRNLHARLHPLRWLTQRKRHAHGLAGQGCLVTAAVQTLDSDRCLMDRGLTLRLINCMYIWFMLATSSLHTVAQHLSYASSGMCCGKRQGLLLQHPTAFHIKPCLHGRQCTSGTDALHVVSAGTASAAHVLPACSIGTARDVQPCRGSMQGQQV